MYDVLKSSHDEHTSYWLSGGLASGRCLDLILKSKSNKSPESGYISLESESDL